MEVSRPEQERAQRLRSTTRRYPPRQAYKRRFLPGDFRNAIGYSQPGHGVSNPFAVKACLAVGDVRNAINAFAASTCLLPELIPATYTEKFWAPVGSGVVLLKLQKTLGTVLRVLASRLMVRRFLTPTQLTVSSLLPL